MTDLDPRLHAYRPDLADVQLKGKVSSARFVEGEIRRVTTPFADLTSAPDSGSGLEKQIIYGHDVRVFDDQNGKSFIQSLSDGYVGYVSSDCLTSDLSLDATHIVLSPRTFIYPDTNIKSPIVSYRSMGSKITVTDFTKSSGTIYAQLAGGGTIIAKHIFELPDGAPTDYVAVGETLLHTPYLWGGNTGFGIDCSGLLYLTHLVCGKDILRDTDMQMASLGKEIVGTDYMDLRRGDLIFWKDHVGILTSSDTLLHANGYTMSVSFESLSQAIKRIEPIYGKPICARRYHK